MEPRLFVVGAPRSGTTLLQGLLAAHPAVHTFPETGLFLRALGMRHRLPWSYLGMTLGKERKALAGLASRAGDDAPALPPRRWCLRRSTADALAFLDGLAAAAGAGAWVEKTPRHVFHAGWIGRHVPGARVVHIVRDGHAVAASIRERARQYPERFTRQRRPAYAVRTWNRAVRATARVAPRPEQTVVRYEDLTADPEGELRRICRETGLVFDPAMTEPADGSAFIRAHEAWKADTAGPVSQRASRFERAFSAAEQAWVEGHLDRHAYRRATGVELP